MTEEHKTDTIIVEGTPLRRLGEHRAPAQPPVGGSVRSRAQGQAAGDCRRGGEFSAAARFPAARDVPAGDAAPNRRGR